ncbi:ribonuclease H-like domain-containing protein [Tanacetum coccineum]
MKPKTVAQSPEKEKSPEKIVEEEVDIQEEIKEVVKEPGTKRKNSIPRKSTRKRQKMEEDAEKEELKEFVDIIPREKVPIEVESISRKFPIVDWKTCVLTKTYMYYQVFRGDGSSKNYKILSKMLEDFDRLDVEELYRLVKERYSASRPEGFDLMLWGDLHTLFEPDEDDEIWKDQHEYKLLSWRLYDFCGIHILLMENGLAIHMLTEKKYPLSQEMISKMLKKKLEVDHESSQAIELLRIDQGVGSTADDICKLVTKYYQLDFTEQERIELRLELQHFELDSDPKLKNVSSLSALCRGLQETEKLEMYPLIDRLIRLILTLHVSTATSERAFSKMKLVKTRLCSTMSDDFLKSSMILSIEREIVSTLCNEKIIDDFYSKSQRRVQMRKKHKLMKKDGSSSAQWYLLQVSVSNFDGCATY